MLGVLERILRLETLRRADRREENRSEYRKHLGAPHRTTTERLGPRYHRRPARHRLHPAIRQLAAQIAGVNPERLAQPVEAEGPFVNAFVEDPFARVLLQPPSPPTPAVAVAVVWNISVADKASNPVLEHGDPQLRDSLVADSRSPHVVELRRENRVGNEDTREPIDRI